MTRSLHLAVRRTRYQGDPSGPPVLLVHGFASRGSADWPDVRWAQPLAARGRDVLVVDLPGHGESAAPDGPAPATAVISALADVVRAAGGAADVVGYSLGARLAWDLASAPGIEVRRLVLGGISPVEPFGLVDVDSARAALSGGAAPADPLTGMILSMAQAPGNDPAALLDVVQGFATEPFDPAATPPRVPTLLLAGLDDPMTQGIEGLSVAVTDGRIERVPGDHIAALRSPELRDAALRFLSD